MHLPPFLSRGYGPLRLDPPPDRPHVLSNFVSSLDGVVSLGQPGTGGPDISGSSREDRFVMALLRAVSDLVIVGAGTLRAFPNHLWTPEGIDSGRADDYARLRASLGKGPAPIAVIVSATGELDLSLPVFSSGRAPATIVTTAAGAQRLRGAGVDVRVAGTGPMLSARAVLDILSIPNAARVLVEGGPRLMASFLEDGCVDELFLTLAPQVIGRNATSPREGLVQGALFVPDRPCWADLLSVRRAKDLLFLRYRFRRIKSAE
jgi:riboflavin biosynthesis pyrimidine reductase